MGNLSNKMFEKKVGTGIDCHTTHQKVNLKVNESEEAKKHAKRDVFPDFETFHGPHKKGILPDFKPFV